MDKNLLKYIKKLGIKYSLYKHEPIFTVADSEKIDRQLNSLPTKNLFLKDKENNFYLVCMYAHKKLNIKKLKEKINAKKKLFFSSPKELKDNLNLTPGSVSIFGMIYAKNVKLIIDEQVWKAELVSFHPNTNTETIEISHEDLEKFYNSLDAHKIIIELD